MIDIKSSKLLDLIPQNLRNDKDIIAACVALDSVKDSTLMLIDKLDFRSNPKVLDEKLIDALSHDLHVDFYDASLPAEVKRNIVDSSLMLHMTKGTASSIERALHNIGVSSEVVEWFDYDASPFHFIVEIAPNFSISNRDMMHKLVMIYKNTRSWFDGFVIVISDEDIIVIDGTYHYPVFYLICGDFSGEKKISQSSAGSLGVADRTYDYPAIYPVYPKYVKQLDLNHLMIINDVYNYQKHYGVTGEMGTLDKFVSTNESKAIIDGEIYEFGMNYHICGELYAGGE